MDDRIPSPQIILEEKDRLGFETAKIIEDNGLTGVFSNFEPVVKKEIEKAMRHILTKELKGLKPDEQIEKLKKIYTQMKGGRKRRGKRTRKRYKSRRRKRTRKRYKSRRRKR